MTSRQKIIMTCSGEIHYAETVVARVGARGTGTSKKEALGDLVETFQCLLGFEIEHEAAFMPPPAEAACGALEFVVTGAEYNAVIDGRDTTSPLAIALAPTLARISRPAPAEAVTDTPDTFFSGEDLERQIPAFTSGQLARARRCDEIQPNGAEKAAIDWDAHRETARLARARRLHTRVSDAEMARHAANCDIERGQQVP